MERKRITDQTSNVNTNNIQRSVNIGDINITCPGVTTTTLKHYIFNTEEDSETDSIVLNALKEEKQWKIIYVNNVNKILSFSQT